MAFEHCSNPSHHSSHLQRRECRLRSAIVLLTKATNFRVFLFFKNKYRVDHGDFVLNLDLRQCVRDAPANVLRVTGLALENHTEANDHGKF